MKIDLLTIQNETFFKELEKRCEIFFVGGSIRDEIIGLESKDVDILVRGLTLDEISKILEPFGKSVINLVGGKQAVLKFKPFNSDEVIDISIPRTEKSNGLGHQNFDILVDPNLPIETDLLRRDFTINSFARDKNFNYVDPFGGREDLKNKIIRVTNKEAFLEDPLRMMRAIRFASRFNFQIEKETFKMIKNNSSNIKLISGERILKELEGIVKKGNPYIGIKLLNETGLFQNIFGDSFKGDIRMFRQVKTIGEFVFCLLYKFENISSIYMKILKGDLTVKKEIDAYEKAFEKKFYEPWENRLLSFKIFNISQIAFQSEILPFNVKEAIREMKKNRYPKCLKELNIDGNDLISLGIKPEKRSKTFEKIIILIMKNKVKNKKEFLIKKIVSLNT